MKRPLVALVTWWLEQRLGLLVHQVERGLWLALHPGSTSVRLPGGRLAGPRLVVVLAGTVELERALQVAQARFGDQPFQSVLLMPTLDGPAPTLPQSVQVLSLREWLADVQEALLDQETPEGSGPREIRLLRFLLREAAYRSPRVPVRRRTWHVVPSDGRWSLKAQGEEDAESFETKDEAVRAGADRARAVELGQLIVHRKDGTFEEERTYGRDPRRHPDLHVRDVP
ncbi:MAG: DUF2188 domain-containing protein [Armatimonadetes bacterium]|nr:DUF2188 domain-containing protein [Armatimonadota bacterium]